MPEPYGKHHSRLLDESPARVRGSLQHWGALRVTMPLMTPTWESLCPVSLGFLFLAAVAFCVAAPATGATPAKSLMNTLAAMWTTLLETPSDQNPFGTGGAAFACLDLGGTVAPFAEGGVESCTVKPGTKIFVAASSFECSTFEGVEGTDAAAARLCARDRCAGRTHGHRRRRARARDRGGDRAPEHRPAREQPLRCGDPEREGLSVGHGWVALLRPLPPGTHTIVIEYWCVDHHDDDRRPVGRLAQARPRPPLASSRKPSQPGLPRWCFESICPLRGRAGAHQSCVTTVIARTSLKLSVRQTRHCAGQLGRVFHYRAKRNSGPAAPESPGTRKEYSRQRAIARGSQRLSSSTGPRRSPRLRSGRCLAAIGGRSAAWRQRGGRLSHADSAAQNSLPAGMLRPEKLRSPSKPLT